LIIDLWPDKHAGNNKPRDLTAVSGNTNLLSTRGEGKDDNDRSRPQAGRADRPTDRSILMLAECGWDDAEVDIASRLEACKRHWDLVRWP
jgi:hypothetical protein